MPDLLWVFAIVGAVALAIVIFSDKTPTGWAREEWRLMWLDTWREEPESAARLAAKQQAARAKMKRLGIQSLLDGRPGWQRINPMSEAPKRASKVVVPMRAPR